MFLGLFTLWPVSCHLSCWLLDSVSVSDHIFTCFSLGEFPGCFDDQLLWFWKRNLKDSMVFMALLLLVREDLQNCDEDLALIGMKSALVWGMSVVLGCSIFIWNKKTFFSQMRVFFLYLYLGSVNLFGGNVLWCPWWCSRCHWCWFWSVLDSKQESQSCKGCIIYRIWLRKELVLRNPVFCCLFWSGWLLVGLWPEVDMSHVHGLPVGEKKWV